MENLQAKESYYIYKLYCEKHKFVRKTNTIASTYSKLNYAPKNKNMLHMINTTAPVLNCFKITHSKERYQDQNVYLCRSSDSE